MDCKNYQKVPPKKEVKTPIQSGTELDKTTSGREQNINNNKPKKKYRYEKDSAVLFGNKIPGTSHVEGAIVLVKDANAKIYPKVIESFNNKMDLIYSDSDIDSSAFYIKGSYSEWNNEQKAYVSCLRNYKIDSYVRSCPVKGDKGSSDIRNITSFRKVRNKNIYYTIEDTYEEFLKNRVPPEYRSVCTGLNMSTRYELTGDIDYPAASKYDEEAFKKVADTIVNGFAKKNVPTPNIICINTATTDSEGNPKKPEDMYHIQIKWYIDRPYVNPLWEKDNPILEEDENGEIICIKKENEDCKVYNALLDCLANVLIEVGVPGVDLGYTGCWTKNPFAKDIYTVRYSEVGSVINRDLFEERFKTEIKNYKEYGSIFGKKNTPKREKKDNTITFNRDVDSDTLFYSELEDPEKVKELKERINDPSAKANDDIDFFINKKLSKAIAGMGISRHLLSFYTVPSIVWYEVNSKEEITRDFVRDITFEVEKRGAILKGTSMRSSKEIESLVTYMLPFIQNKFDSDKKAKRISRWTDDDRKESIRKKKEISNLENLKFHIFTELEVITPSRKKKIINNKDTLKEIDLSRNTVEKYWKTNHYHCYIKAKEDLKIEKEILKNLYLKYDNPKWKPAFVKSQELLVKELEEVIALYEYVFFGKVWDNIEEIKEKVLSNYASLYYIRDFYSTYFYRKNSNSKHNSYLSADLQYQIYKLLKPDILELAS